MERRQFVRGCVAVGGALLGRNAFDFARLNLGFGDEHSAPRKLPLPEETPVDGRIAGVDGTTVRVSLTGADRRTPIRLRVVRRSYPTGVPVTAVETGRVRPPADGESSTVGVTVPRDGRTPDPWFYEVQIRSANADDPYAYLCESRPYQWPSASGDELHTADRVADAPAPTSGRWYDRRLRDNEYDLTFRWRDRSNAAWAVDYRVRRSTHEAAVAGDRGYVETYEDALASPVVRDLAAALETTARPVDGPFGAPSDGGEQPAFADLDDGERFDAFVGFVQGIEYLRDADSMGVYDYNRTVPETLVAGVGDCKDRTHLLSGLLAAAFDCEPVLLFQPGHLLLGVDADDIPALPYASQTVTLGGRDLVPIEPSLSVPVSHYADEPFIAAYGDGEWFYHDVGALGDSVDDVVHDWVAKTDPIPELR